MTESAASALAPEEFGSQEAVSSTVDTFLSDLDRYAKSCAAPIEQIYVSFRKQGALVRAFWLSPQPASMTRLRADIAPLWPAVDSAEVVLNHSAKNLEFTRRTATRFNCHRGVRSLFLQDASGGRSRWAATQMIAQNLSFEHLFDRHWSANTDPRPTNQAGESLSATLFDTEQYFVDLKSKHWTRLFRGGRLVEPEDISRQSVLETIRAMTSWLARQVNDQGRCEYKYWPSRDEYSAANNAIRQWMATICLGRAALAFGSQELKDLAHRNLTYNLKQTYKEAEGVGYIWLDGSAKLGAAALAALAILESPFRREYLQQEYGLRRLVHKLTNSDGSFRTFYIPAERTDNQNFYSGEALLFLAQEYAISRSPELLQSIRSSFNYYQSWHLKNRNPAFVPWHTQAYYLLWKATGDNTFADFIFTMNDWLLSMQQWDSAPYPDMRGRFYDPSRPHFGPPHASSTGVYLEGLIDAFSVAQACGEPDRAERYRIAIVRGIRSVVQLQFKDEAECFYAKSVARLLGGIRTNVYDNTIRIDNVQHNLMALLKIYTRFGGLDYRIESTSCGFKAQPAHRGQGIMIESVIKHSLPLWDYKEVLKHCPTRRAYNSQPWVAASVIARSPRPRSNSIYFATRNLDAESGALERLPNPPSVILAEPINARSLAKVVACPVYEVASVLESARALADTSRARTKAKIIGITGSVGKTSVKNALTQLLALQGSTHSTVGNANDGWGVLETLMNLPVDACYGVMELGMLGTNSIKIKSERIRPHVGIITNIDDAHLAYHGEQTSIAQTKSGLFSGIGPDGIAILPSDSSWFGYLRDKAKGAGICDIITFGSGLHADFGLISESTEGSRHFVQAKVLGKPTKFEIGAAGSHWAVNAMSVLAGIYAVGGDIDAAISAMETIKPSFRRGEVHHIETSSIRYTVVDDTWNASPASVVAALKSLSSIAPPAANRKVLFLGDMLQLGKDEVEKHIGLLDSILESGIDKVFTVGQLSQKLFDNLPAALKGERFSDARQAAAVARGHISHNDVVVVKGSNVMEMWRVVQALCKQPCQKYFV